MDWWQAIILGLVEGITEYLPVSSTGHLILTTSLLGVTTDANKAAIDAYTIVIQGGAILAVLGLYAASVRRMILGMFGRDTVGLRLVRNLLIAFLPAAALGPLLEDTIDHWLFRPAPVLAALLLGGVWMIALGRGWRKREQDAQPGAAHDDDAENAPTSSTDALARLSWRVALGIGLFQVVAMWPGTSRSMMTIAGAMLLGLTPRKAAEFSFLLGLPTLGGATVYKLLGNLRNASAMGGPNLFDQLGAANVVLGFIVATIAATVAVRWLVAFLTKHGLAAFGWYRVALSLALLALWLANIVAF